MLARPVRLSFQWLRWCALLWIAWLGTSACLAADTAAPRHVLLIHSFGRDFAPYDAISSSFRTELTRGASAPIVLFETALDAGRVVTPEEEAAFVDYLQARFAGQPPDVVVTIGPPAARLYLAHRDELFQATPLLIGALDERFVRSATLLPNDSAVASNIDIPRLFENIFQLLPDTTTVAVVLGASSQEQFWLKEAQRDSMAFSSRAKFLWFNDLTLEQMKEEVAKLPPHSAVLYGQLIIDAAGVVHERQDALTALHAASNAPIFGLFEGELGKGVVGGPYSSQHSHGVNMAHEVNRNLLGQASESPRVQVQPFEPPVYDWRELRRWSIDSSRLPAGSEIRFRPPSLWEEHRGLIVFSITVMALQTALIAGLLWQRLRRRRAENEARDLGGRLITAHEDERRRLARDLHDDITQRLAALAIQVSTLEARSVDPAGLESVHSIRDRLIELSEDVHALSYRLHPTVIEDLGLVEALRSECDRVGRSDTLRVRFEAEGDAAGLPPDAAVGVFRVAQAALRNVVRHAKASEVLVSLARTPGRLVLSVRDDGIGFDTASKAHGGSLGIASMRERMRLLGGAIDIESAAGRGTNILAWLPLGEAR